MQETTCFEYDRGFRVTYHLHEYDNCAKPCRNGWISPSLHLSGIADKLFDLHNMILPNAMTSAIQNIFYIIKIKIVLNRFCNLTQLLLSNILTHFSSSLIGPCCK